MPSGQELSKINLKKFKNWRSTKSDDDFKQYVFRNKLNRQKIALECEFSTSVFYQNPDVIKVLLDLEDSLKLNGILHQKTTQNQKDLPQIIEKPESPEIKDLINHLENENMSLKVENKALKEYLKKYNMIDSFLSETMRIPR